MNAIYENILSRRSIRSFVEGKKIPREELERIVTAGMFAPTALNLQPVLFTVVTDTKKIQHLAKTVGRVMDRGEGYDFYAPEAIIITSCDKDARFIKEDTSCALENIFLYAHSIGVGSVWINQLVVCCNNPEVRAILTEFGIPENHVCGGMAALGYIQKGSERDLTRKCRVNYVD